MKRVSGYHQLALYDLAGELKVGLNLAFYRTFAIPAIGGLLAQTGEITGRAQKRADDTGIIMYSLMYYGFDDPEGKRVLQRLVGIHSRYQIANEDFLYVLSCLAVVPTRWVAEFGSRALTPAEEEGTAAFYQELGQQMGLAGVPGSYREFERFFDDYDERHLKPHPGARQLIEASRGVLAARFPKVMRPIAGQCADAMLDDRLRTALGLPAPSAPIRWITRLLLRLKTSGKQKPAFTPGQFVTSYPDGYDIDTVGPL